jgi:hypothetical protein
MVVLCFRERTAPGDCGIVSYNRPAVPHDKYVEVSDIFLRP